MSKAKSYARNKVTESYDAIIIGSGIGGMATAGYLSKQGKKVVVLERNYTPGGFTQVFKRRDYEWDVGIHYIGDVHREHTMIRKQFDYLTDGKLEWAYMGDVYDKAIFGDDVYEFRSGPQEFVEQMSTYFPDETEAIEKYVALIYEAQRSQGRYFMEKALPKFVSNLMGGSMRKKALNYNRSVLDVLSDLTDNKKLIAVLTTQFGDYGLPPAQASFMIHSMVVKHYLNGGNFPVGGSSRLFDTILPVVQKAGGEVYISAEVKEIIVNNNKAVGVRMEDDREILAPLVISGAGIYNTYKKLLPTSISEKNGLGAQADKIEPSVGHVCLYIGFKHSTADLQLEKPNLWIYPDNYDHDKNIAAYIADPEAELPVVYVSFPSAKDPDWDNRYPGRATIDVITLAPFDRFKKWEGTRWHHRGEEYEAEKEKLAQRLLEALYKQVPQLRGKVDYYELSTPLSTQHFANYQAGELYGINHTPERFEQRFLRPQTPIKNLYLTGQDVISCGVGGALAGGMLTASAILRKNLMKELYK